MSEEKRFRKSVARSWLLGVATEKFTIVHNYIKISYWLYIIYVYVFVV